jgi:hypothetical protein
VRAVELKVAIARAPTLDAFGKRNVVRTDAHGLRGQADMP